MPISPQVQLERRTRLLAKTREMIREVGVEQLNIRELADYCGVSVPTLYNQFRNKNNLVFTAADEIFRWHFEKIPPATEISDFDELINVCDSTAEIILKNGELARLIVPKVPKGTNSLALATKLYCDILLAMQKRGEIVDWIDTDITGQRLYNRIRGVSMEWSSKMIPNNLFAPTRRLELSLSLLGITTGKTQLKVQKLVQRSLLELKDK